MYETFIAACYEKADEVDDSAGYLGMFGGSLFARWVTARQADFIREFEKVVTGSDS
jgi:poly-beta-hydroxyalkanoate depolymerase